MIILGMGCWEEDPKGKGIILMTSYQKYILSTWLTTVDINLDMTEVMFVRFLHCKGILLASFPYLTLWKGITTCSPYLRTTELFSPSLTVDCLHKLFGILHGKCVYPPPFIRSINYISMDWVIIQYCFIFLFKLFQLWPLRTLSIGSHDPLTYPHHWDERGDTSILWH